MAQNKNFLQLTKNLSRTYTTKICRPKQKLFVLKKSRLLINKTLARPTKVLRAQQEFWAPRAKQDFCALNKNFSRQTKSSCGNTQKSLTHNTNFGVKQNFSAVNQI